MNSFALPASLVQQWLEAGWHRVLTLWSSSALAFGCCSWQGGKVSESRYGPRDDGLMRLRSRLSSTS